MKAVAATRWGGPEVLELVEGPEPVPSDGEVVIRVSVAGVNFADVAAREGKRGGSPPLIPGLEVAGEVVKVGPGVLAPSAGDRVAAFVSSGYAEFAVAKAELTWRLPDNVSFEVGAAFPTIGVTAINLLTKAARLQPGETVMIWSAAGGVGTTAAQLARTLGAARVIGVVGRRDKVATAERAGCDDVVVSSEEDLTARILELTHDKGVDVILNAVAGEELETDVERLADFGRLAVYGMAAGRPGLIPSNSLHSRSCSLVGYSTSTYRSSRPNEVNTTGRAVLGLLEAGRIEIFRGSDFALEDAAEAHRHIESRRSVGKILLHVNKSVS
jgi:NADPH:quinone reductase